MPVLQKEADILPSTHESDRMDITVNVDTFHSTVTPPPTPPGDKVIIERKTDDAKLMETFKSHLASPTNGLKLTINREKVKADTCDNIDILSKMTGGVDGEQNYTKAAIQSFLLQDALQSARKYKEKLKQNSQSLPPKPIIQVPTVNSKVFECKKAEHAISHSIPSPPIQTKVERDSQQSTHNQVQKDVHNKQEQLSRRQTAQPTKQQMNDAVPTGMPSMDDMKHLTDMSFQDFLAVMSSIYGYELLLTEYCTFHVTSIYVATREWFPDAHKHAMFMTRSCSLVIHYLNTSLFPRDEFPHLLLHYFID